MYKYVLHGFPLKEKIRRKMVLFLVEEECKLEKWLAPRTRRFGKIYLIKL
jgi:hypothetical protein